MPRPSPAAVVPNTAVRHNQSMNVEKKKNGFSVTTINSEQYDSGIVGLEPYIFYQCVVRCER